MLVQRADRYLLPFAGKVEYFCAQRSIQCLLRSLLRLRHVQAPMGVQPHPALAAPNFGAILGSGPHSRVAFRRR